MIATILNTAKDLSRYPQWVLAAANLGGTANKKGARGK